METQTVYMLSKTDKIKVWHIRTEADMIITSHGFIDGKLQVSEKRATPKNVGKKNATTASQQAILQAKSMLAKKIDDGYVFNLDNIKSNEKILPMLACDYNSRKQSIKFPCHIQPKLDGIRLICRIRNGSVNFYTRKGKDINHLDVLVSQILESLNDNTIDLYLDGELFNTDMDFQAIISSAKRKQESTDDLQYHIYDIYNTDNLEFRKRHNIIKTLFGDISNSNIKLVETRICDTPEQIKTYHDEFVSKNYEGIIIRNSDGLYKPGYRSADLQKYKEFEDSEYKIVGAKMGVGRYDGCVIWDCIVDTNVFSVKQKGSIEDLQDMWINKDRYIGKLLTVKYQGKSTIGVPRFPVGISIRDYE